VLKPCGGHVLDPAAPAWLQTAREQILPAATLARRNTQAAVYRPSVTCGMSRILVLPETESHDAACCRQSATVIDAPLHKQDAMPAPPLDLFGDF
jgi:hypothetical protein